MLIGGRSAIQVGVASFMAAASDAYRELDNSSTQQLVEQLVEEGKDVVLTAAEVVKRGTKVFGKILKLVSMQLV